MSTIGFGYLGFQRILKRKRITAKRMIADIMIIRFSFLSLYRKSSISFGFKLYDTI